MSRLVSAHFDGRRFRNPSGGQHRGFPAFFRMALVERRVPWPRHVPVAPRTPPPVAHASEVVVTFIGHSTFLVQTSAGNLLTDPIYSDRASPVRWFGPRRVRQPGVEFDVLPRIDVVLVSHNHYDHLDVETVERLQRRFAPRFVTGLGNAGVLQRAGAADVSELDWWQRMDLGGLGVTMTPARHFSARTLLDRNRSLWGGFFVTTPHQSVLFGGDSGYGPHFTEIRSRLGPPDVALLPIGAYEPRWFMRDMHMNPDDAVRAHVDLGSRQSVAMHFGTFPLAMEGIDHPSTALRRALEVHDLSGTTFHLPDVGESVRVSPQAPEFPVR